MCKDKQSGRVRQYNPKKSCKWEFKNLVRAGESGIYHFFLYSGKNSTSRNSCYAEAIVLRPLKGIPKNEGYRLFFDNWFSIFDVILLSLKT